MPEVLDTIITFLNGVGISVREGLVPEPSFLPGVRVYGGELTLDRALLRWPGDLLHEHQHACGDAPPFHAWTFIVGARAVIGPPP